jgi:hypothetical protein
LLEEDLTLSDEDLTLSDEDLTLSDEERPDVRAWLLLLDRLESPGVLLFDRLEDSTPLDSERLELDRLERLALIFLYIMARLLRRFVNRIPRNMKKLPMRHNEPRRYFALLATLKLAKACPVDEAMPIDFDVAVMRSVFWHMGVSTAVHDLLPLMRAPAVEYAREASVFDEYIL